MVAKDLDTGEINVFEDKESFIIFSRLVSNWIGHNCIAFDCPVISRLWGYDFQESSVADTLVIARLLNYKQPGGNSLDAWGSRFGLWKLGFNDFGNYSKEMLEYCKRDVEITSKLFGRFRGYLDSDWSEAIKTEHKIAWLCNELQDNGFAYDRHKADALRIEIRDRLSGLEDTLSKTFPPRAYKIREITPRATKTGSLAATDFRWLKKARATPTGVAIDSSETTRRGSNSNLKDILIDTIVNPGQDCPLYHVSKPESTNISTTQYLDLSNFSVGEPFTLIDFKPFKPSSPKQCVTRLWEFGWEPTSKTKGHLEAERDRSPKLSYFKTYGWRIDDENLKTLPTDAPEGAKELARWLLFNSRVHALDTWGAALRPSVGPPEDTWHQRIHGRFSGIGAWTHRMSHAEPNMANIPSGNEDETGNVPEYSEEFRRLWIAAPGKLLLGCDADGIQLRVLAHYMSDSVFTEALINGDSKLGTDAHSLNWKTLGNVCASRAIAKRFIYAWLLGAGRRKVAQIFDCTVGDADRAVASFIGSYGGLQELKEFQIPGDARRGYFVGFDDRKILCSSEHYMLAGYLQAGEAILMKHAALLWKERLKGYSKWYKFIDFVHDEWVLEIEADASLAEEIGQIVSGSIKETGERFELNCPMKGNYKTGQNWFEVH